MKNNMKYNLSKILFAINNKIDIITNDIVELYLNDDNSLHFKMGEITSSVSNTKLQKVLDDNNSENYNDQNENSVIEILSKYFVNKLMMLQGKKNYSLIKSSDFHIVNKKDLNKSIQV